jgi:hypothetical protein
MPVIVVGAEKNFAALRRRLFSGSVSTKAAGEVSAAIQAANPHADLKALRPGTVLTIPDDLPHVAVGGDLSVDPTTRQVAVRIVTAGTTTLTELTSAVQSGAKDTAAARRRLAKTLSGQELTDAAAKDKAIAASLAAAQEALAAADAGAQARADALAQAQSEWNAELEALKASFAG